MFFMHATLFIFLLLCTIETCFLFLHALTRNEDLFMSKMMRSGLLLLLSSSALSVLGGDMQRQNFEVHCTENFDGKEYKYPVLLSQKELVNQHEAQKWIQGRRKGELIKNEDLCRSCDDFYPAIFRKIGNSKADLYLVKSDDGFESVKETTFDLKKFDPKRFNDKLHRIKAVVTRVDN